MKILVLGAGGMLGHEVLASLSSRHDVAGTLRGKEPQKVDGMYGAAPKIHTGIDVRRFASVKRVLSDFRPDAVVNAVGIIKQVVDPDYEADVRKIKDKCRVPAQTGRILR